MNNISNLTALLTSSLSPLGLSAVLIRIFGAGSVPKGLEKLVRKRLNGQLGRTSARALAQRTYKNLAAVMGPEAPGTLDQRLQIGELMAQSAALQHTQIAECILIYQKAQAELERARDTGAEDNMRAAREAAETSLEQAYIDVGRILIGDAPQDQ